MKNKNQEKQNKIPGSNKELAALKWWVGAGKLGKVEMIVRESGGQMLKNKNREKENKIPGSKK